ncbi:MAG: pyrroline-5-carboxylate reductase [Flavobacteriales bacterium]|nr:pyrroline-5-carboxylate reductase [Flavobacteriales bacterium]
MEQAKVAIIGCGNLGISIANGLLGNAAYTGPELIATRRHLAPLEALRARGVQLSTDNREAAVYADVLLLGLKPYNVVSVARELVEVLDPKRHIAVSLATGITVADIQQAVGPDIPVFRAMPNTAADVRASMTCLSSTCTDPAKVQAVQQLFAAIGTTLMIDEELMGSATVLGACGIAYVLRFIRAMVQGGIEIGFDAESASLIVNQTVKGAVELLIERGRHPEEEIDKVTTPKGCTIVGLNTMEHHGFSSSLIRGLVASADKIGH